MLNLRGAICESVNLKHSKMYENYPKNGKKSHDGMNSAPSMCLCMCFCVTFVNSVGWCKVSQSSV